MVWTDRSLNPWSPFAVRGLADADRIFRRALSAQDSVAPTNVWANGDEIRVRALVPGFAPGEVDVTVEDRTLTLRGEATRETGGEERAEPPPFARAFERRFHLPFRIDAERVEAKLAHGVLELTLPRAEADRRKKITIESSVD